MKSSLNIIAILIGLFMLSSCGIGPFIEHNPENPYLPGAKGKKVIVSQFVQSERYISITESQNIVNILESASVKDISFQISKAMAEHGIESEAIKNPANYKLKENEILLKGAITPGYKVGTNLAALTLFLVFPIVLPTPWSYPQFYGLNYFYEISDHNGKILFSSEFKAIEGKYKNYYVYGTMNGKRYQKLKVELEKRIKDEIADILK